MKVWELKFKLNDYVNLWPIWEMEVTELQTFDGRSKIDSWKTMKAERIQSTKSRPLPNATHFYVLIPAFDKKALEALRDLMEGAVEILPIEFEGTLWHGIYVTKVLDAIDHEKAIAKILSTGRILRFEKYAFMAETVQGNHIFKIADTPLFCEFVTEEFKNLVEGASLVGFDFQLVWDSEAE